MPPSSTHLPPRQGCPFHLPNHHIILHRKCETSIQEGPPQLQSGLEKAITEKTASTPALPILISPSLRRGTTRGITETTEHKERRKSKETPARPPRGRKNINQHHVRTHHKQERQSKKKNTNNREKKKQRTYCFSQPTQWSSPVQSSQKPSQLVQFNSITPATPPPSPKMNILMIA